MQVLGAPHFFLAPVKVIYPKHSKHWPNLLASAMSCSWSDILKHGLNHGLFFSILKLFGWKYVHPKN